MNHHRSILLVALLLSCPGLRAQPIAELRPIAFLAGEFQGSGTNAFGRYEEEQAASWQLGGQILVVETRSSMGGRTVFEDRRVFSFDATAKKIRMRQWAMGDLAIYEVRVEDGGLHCVETAHEGSNRREWSYRFTPKEEGFTYVVERRGDDGKLARFVGGSLEPKLADPAEQGPLGRRSEQAKIAGLDTETWIPEGDGPFPTVLFAPGGGARSTRGYAPFARWFASWGYSTVIIALNERDATKAAALFSKVADALPERHDPKRLATAGHSLGAAAAVVASRKDARFQACLALAPAGPDAAPGGPPTLVIVGGQDLNWYDQGTSLFATLGKPAYLVDISTMNHGFGPPDDGMKVLARATAFLQTHVLGNPRYLSFLTREEKGTRIEVRK